MSDLSGHTVNGIELTWKQLYERERERAVALEGYRSMLTDLDRNAGGRHQGDVDGGDPTGVSQGNPHLETGQMIGYSISGTRQAYVVPEPRLRGNIDAWIVRPGRDDE